MTASSKQQAASSKQQAASSKQQAASSKQQALLGQKIGNFQRLRNPSKTSFTLSLGTSATN
jgi:hypothetical protein